MVHSADGYRYRATPTKAMVEAVRANRGRPVLAYVYRDSEGEGPWCAPVADMEETADGKFRQRAPYIPMPVDPEEALDVANAHRIPAMYQGWFRL